MDPSLADLAWAALGVAVALWLARGPDALGRLHEALDGVLWRWRSRGHGGRPRIDRALINLIHRMSLENPLWGAPRIHAELLKLGYSLAQSTVSKYMIPRRGRPIGTWTTFLRDNAEGIAAIDLFSVPTLSFQRLYAVVVLAHGRRRILRVDVTDHPTAFWLAQQITETFPWDEAPRLLVRDNDGAFGFVFRRRVRAMGVRDRPIRPHSPWMNGHVERLIGSFRRECLDYHLIWNAAHLRRVLRTYADGQQQRSSAFGARQGRTHFARGGGGRGEIISHSRVGGLHHRYGRIPRR